MRALLVLIVAAVWFEAATTARWGEWLPAHVESYTPHLRRIMDPALRHGERIAFVNGRPLQRPEDWERAFLDTPIGGTVQVQLDGHQSPVAVRVPTPHLTWPMGIALVMWLVLMPLVLFRAWRRPNDGPQLALYSIAASMAIGFAATFTSWPLDSVWPRLAWILTVMAIASTPILSLLAFPTRIPWLRSLAWAVLVLMPLSAAAIAQVGYTSVLPAVLLELLHNVVLDLIRHAFVLRLYLKLF